MSGNDCAIASAANKQNIPSIIFTIGSRRNHLNFMFLDINSFACERMMLFYVIKQG